MRPGQKKGNEVIQPVATNPHRIRKAVSSVGPSCATTTTTNDDDDEEDPAAAGGWKEETRPPGLLWLLLFTASAVHPAYLKRLLQQQLQ